MRLRNLLSGGIPLWASALGCALWWLHAALNHLVPPNDGPLDTLLYWVANACWLLLLASLPFLFVRLCQTMYLNKGAVVRCLLCWVVGLGLVVGVLALLRDPLAELLNNSATRFYPVRSGRFIDDPFHYLGREEWLPRWQSGQIILLEVIGGLLPLVVLSAVAYRFGKKKAAIVGLGIGLLVMIVAWPILTGVLFVDYDFFLGGIFSDSLALDFIVPFWVSDPTSEISFTVLLVFVVSTLLALRWLRATEERASPLTGVSS